MRTITTRQFRNKPGQLKDLLAEGEVMLTANGDPVALMIPAGESLEETMDLLRQIRLQRSIRTLRRDAAARGIDKMKAKDIAQQIKRSRADRR